MQNTTSDYCIDTQALEVLGSKWILPIIWHLSTCESMRYNELKRIVHGITNIMLTRSLKMLTSYGLVCRKQISEIPLHVEYSLTDVSKELVPALQIINAWGQKNLYIFENALKNKTN